MPPITAITTASTPRRSNSRPSTGPKPRAASRSSTPSTPDASPAGATATPPAEKAKKPRRARVPQNMAQMYGENLTRRDPEAPVPAEAKRPRRDARERALRKSVMQVDGALLERLAKAPTAALVVGEEEAPARRGRTWQAACGKCGARSTFRTPGALCPGCGAICLRDAA